MHPRINLAVAEYLRIREGLLAEFPDIDPETLTDTLDGETGIYDIIDRFIRDARQDDAMAEALSPMQRDMAERKARFTARAERLRDAALKLMNTIGERKIIRPDYTASVRTVPPKVIVTDETALPDPVCKFERKPDKAAIKEALEQGKTVTGATLSNGTQALSIRTK